MEKLALHDIVSHGETVDFECKSAQGRDGTGDVPGSFWETYSAMANTDGGEVYLGIDEPSKGKFHVSAAPRSHHLTDSSPHLVGNSSHLAGSSIHLPNNSLHLQEKLAQILSSNKLKKIPGKINVELMRRIIMQLCDNTMCTRNEISALLDRDPVALQNRYLTPMVAEGLLEMKYPANKNHPDQAYRTRKT